MSEVKALDKIQRNFQFVRTEIDTEYLNNNYPEETDVVVSLYQRNLINEHVAQDLLLQLTNDVIPDRIRGL